MKNTITTMKASDAADKYQPIFLQSLIAEPNPDVNYKRRNSIEKDGVFGMLRVTSDNYSWDGHHILKDCIDLGLDIRVETHEELRSDDIEGILSRMRATNDTSRSMLLSQELATTILQVEELCKAKDISMSQAYKDLTGRKNTTKYYDILKAWSSKKRTRPLFDLAHKYGLPISYLQSIEKYHIYKTGYYNYFIETIDTKLNAITHEDIEGDSYESILKSRCKEVNDEIFQEIKNKDFNFARIFKPFRDKTIEAMANSKNFDQILRDNGYETKNPMVVKVIPNEDKYGDLLKVHPDLYLQYSKELTDQRKNIVPQDYYNNPKRSLCIEWRKIQEKTFRKFTLPKLKEFNPKIHDAYSDYFNGRQGFDFVEGECIKQGYNWDSMPDLVPAQKHKATDKDDETTEISKGNTDAEVSSDETPNDKIYEAGICDDETSTGGDDEHETTADEAVDNTDAEDSPDETPADKVSEAKISDSETSADCDDENETTADEDEEDGTPATEVDENESAAEELVLKLRAKDPVALAAVEEGNEKMDDDLEQGNVNNKDADEIEYSKAEISNELAELFMEIKQHTELSVNIIDQFESIIDKVKQLEQERN